ncbi:MAG: DUF547 domain-containing protein [Bdellovibrionota bacterium]
MKPKIIFIFFILLSSSYASAFDHQYKQYQRVLEKHVKYGGIDYTSLKADRKELDQFIESLSSLLPNDLNTWDRNHQMAFWINSYNALVLQSIINCYPIPSGVCPSRWFSTMFYPSNSIRQIRNVWSKKHSIAGYKLSLDQIEHGILRAVPASQREIAPELQKEFHEPRVHFALNCGSISCPELIKTPYHADHLEAQLERQAQKFINLRSVFRVREDKELVILSKIFQWYREDFEQAQGRQVHGNPVLAYVFDYWKDPRISRNDFVSFHTEYFEYDWSLNDRSAANGL